MVINFSANLSCFYIILLTLLCISEERQKNIDIESICELLYLVLGSTYMPQVNSFIEYLKVPL